jgi:hypothetical protein
LKNINFENLRENSSFTAHSKISAILDFSRKFQWIRWNCIRKSEFHVLLLYLWFFFQFSQIPAANQRLTICGFLSCFSDLQLVVLAAGVRVGTILNNLACHNFHRLILLVSSHHNVEQRILLQIIIIKINILLIIKKTKSILELTHRFNEKSKMASNFSLIFIYYTTPFCLCLLV